MSDTTLVRAKVAVGGLLPGKVGEMPTKIAKTALRLGYAERADRLSDRLTATEDSAPEHAEAGSVEA